MTKEETGRKIENAVYSIGVEEAIKSPPKFMRMDMEWTTVIFKLAPDGGGADVATNLSNLLNEGWVISRDIIVSPYVIIIFWREKKEAAA